MNRLFSLVIILSSLSIASLSNATGADVPKGAWRCTFWGQEWQMVPGPTGPHYELQQTAYTSNWKKTKSAAYDEAADDCDRYSDTSCHFSSCKQKSR